MVCGSSLNRNFQFGSCLQEARYTGVVIGRYKGHSSQGRAREYDVSCVSGARAVKILLSDSIAFALTYFLPLPVLTCDAAGVEQDFVLDFSGYTGGAVDDWLRARHFTFENDAKNRRLLQLSVANDISR